MNDAVEGLQPKRDLLIPKSMEKLAEGISDLVEAVNQLQTKLKPVSIEKPWNLDDPKDEELTKVSPLCNDIITNVNKINSIVKKVLYMMDCLEI